MRTGYSQVKAKDNIYSWKRTRQGNIQVKVMYGTRFLVVSLYLGFHPILAASSEPLNVILNPRKANHVLDEKFVSITLNPTDLLQGRPFGMATNTTLTILQGLAPAYVRLGGPDTNRYFFRSHKNAEDTIRSPDEYTVTEEHWKDVNDFMKRVGMEVVICLNSGHRGGAFEKWDPRNSLELISFSDRQQYNLTWELGYEPMKTGNMVGTHLGKDMTQLRAMLNAFPRYQQAKIVGPDIRVLHRKEDMDNVLDVLIEAGPAINAVTWHPRWPHVSSITPSDTSEDGYDFPPDYLEWDSSQLHKLLQRTLLKKPFWIGEPKAENTGSFAEGLIFARRLALAAKLGIEVVMKQPSLKDIAHPKPEFWIAYLHKKTLGRTLLDTRSITNHSEISLVVQCTSKRYGHDQDGGVTVLAVNTAGAEQRAAVRGLPPGHLGGAVHQYLLTAGKDTASIFSQMTYINGEPLLMGEDGKLPELSPKIKHLGQVLLIKLPPYSAGFWVVPQAKIKICQDEPQPLLPLNLEQRETAEVLKTAQKGIHNLRNRNHILVEKLLNPTTSGEKEDQEEKTDVANSHEGKLKRANRQNSADDLGYELGKRVKEIQDLMDMNLHGWDKSEEGNTENENHLRAAEVKIDGLAADLNRIINGASQEKEFGRFLEASGLKTDFGKLMMKDRSARATRKPALEDELELEDSAEKVKRRKRQLKTNNIFVKDGFMDLAEIEKRYQRILAKHKKSMEHPKKFSKVDFGKINKELHEELILKEIALLEKTEETLEEVMKNHQERQAAVEELLIDELEQMKEEKLEALVEMKKESNDIGKDPIVMNHNALERKIFHRKEEGKVSPKKRETISEPDSQLTTESIVNKTEAIKKEDPFNIIQNFLTKRKEELNKRTHLQEKLLEMRKKLKLDMDKNKEKTEVTTNAPTTTAIVTEAAVEENSNTDPPNSADTLKNGEKRRIQVLKYMTEYVDNMQANQSKVSSNEAADGEDIFSQRKPRKTNLAVKESIEKEENANAAAAVIKILDALMESKSEGTKTFQAFEESNAEPKREEGDAVLHTEESNDIPEGDGESNPVSTSSNDTENVLEESYKKTTEKFSDKPDDQTEKSNADQRKFETESNDSTQQVKYDGNTKGKESNDRNEIEQEDDQTNPRNDDEKSKATADPEFGKNAGASIPQHKTMADIPKSRQERTRRDTYVTDPPTLTQESNRETHTNSEEILTNTIVKKELSKQGHKTSAEETKLQPDDVLDLAGSTVQAVLDQVIPEAYGQAKNKIESLGLPNYIRNLGRMVEKLEDIDTVIKGVGNLATKASSSKSTPNHIQKIERTKRELEDDQGGMKENLNNHINPTVILTTTEMNQAGEDITENLAVETQSTEKPESSSISSIDEETVNDSLLNEVLDTMAEEMLKNETERRGKLQKEQDTFQEKDASKDKPDSMEGMEEAEDPVSPRLASEQNIMQKIIENLMKKQQARATRIKGKREIPPIPPNVYMVENQVNTFKREADESTAAGLPGSYPFQSLEPVSQFLRQLRPGVYVVPSKDMANVHAEQTAKTAITPKDGKHMPNVLTLNIYYDKKAPEEKGVLPIKSEVASPAVPQPYYSYSGSEWPTEPAFKSFSQFKQSATAPVAPEPMFPSLRKMYDPRYQIQTAPPRPYTTLRAPSPVPKYNNGYSPINQDAKLYNRNYIYEEPDPLKPSPKLIPVSPFSTWTKSETQPEIIQDTQWQVKDETGAEDVNDDTTKEEKGMDSWYLKKASDEPPVYVKKEIKKDKEISFYDKKKSIEPYWNRTLKEIFHETAKDPFWKFLEEPDSKNEESGVMKLGESEEKLEGTDSSRKKRSLEYRPTYSNAYNNIQFDTKPFEDSYLASEPATLPYQYYLEQNMLEYGQPEAQRSRRSMLDNFVTKERLPERYLVDSDRIVHQIFPRKQLFKKLSDPDSSLEAGGEVTNFQVVSPPIAFTAPNPVPPNLVINPVNPFAAKDFPFSMSQLYDIAVDFIKRMMISPDA